MPRFDWSSEQLANAHDVLYGAWWERLRPLPGATELLQAVADRGHAVILASSAKESELEQLRRVVGAEDVIAACDQVARIPIVSHSLSRVIPRASWVSCVGHSRYRSRTSPNRREHRATQLVGASSAAVARCNVSIARVSRRRAGERTRFPPP